MGILERGLTNAVAGTNGYNVTHTRVVSADGSTLYSGSTGSGVFTRLTVPFDEVGSLPLVWR